MSSSFSSTAPSNFPTPDRATTDWFDPDRSLDGLKFLARTQVRFRITRFWNRLFSPRQAIASVLSVTFVGLYLLAGITLLSRREANDPEQLRLWLSGGMILYALYHAVKQLWSQTNTDMDLVTLTEPDRLWLGGGPIARRTLVLREATSAIPSSMAKTVLLGVVLWRDAVSLVSLLLGVCLALVALELLRRLISHLIAALSPNVRRYARATSLLVGLAILMQLGIQTWQSTPPGSDPLQYVLSGMSEIGHYAGSTAIQSMAFALLPAASLASGEAITSDLAIPGIHQLIATIPVWLVQGLLAIFAVAVIAGLAECLVWADRWSSDRQLAYEQRRLKVLQQRRTSDDAFRDGMRHKAMSPTRIQRFGDWLARLLPDSYQGMSGLVVRQLQCVRRYAANVVVSFAIPMALSLSPLLTDQSTKQWVFVIGGIALSSLLLAPPALQIDFRRDLKRMFLVRSLPLGDVAMCVGMLSVPVAITILFQWTTLGLGTLIASPPGWQTLWLFLALPSLAVATFAIENALFLAFPHHVHAQGIAMVIRAKVTFLWKGMMLAIAPMALVTFAMLCERVLPPKMVGPVAFTGSLTAVWGVAGLAGWTLVRCWRRFDPLLDTPPE
ncbi:hypothetical protein [Rhodopirellula halodulae]|uniref:hypothetical protein n=1 Tax=Rhodopirellula halodulae TaxID=2894198 RepID=UPI001E3E4B19|nr:hypothetical protein [Rhodopirellula sp. JC737]MCC9654975.1 hypothetical protein [Rhodopirellula sp. JC737]